MTRLEVFVFFARLISDSCLEGVKTYQEKLRAQEIADASAKEDADTEKKVSRFEGDIDLQGVDEADLEAQEVEAELTSVEGEPAAAGAAVKTAAPVAEKAPEKAIKKTKKTVTKGE